MKKIKGKEFEFWVKTTQIESFEGLIILDLWLWKLILEVIEGINKSEISIKFDLV
jgi:hypothetical protein